MSYPPEISAPLGPPCSSQVGLAPARSRTLLSIGGRENLHFVLTTILTAALLPALHGLGLPMRFNWKLLAGFYWPSLATQSLLAAVVLYLAAAPRQLLGPWWERHRQQKARLAILAILVLPASLLLGVAKGLLVTVVTAAVLEFVELERATGQTRKKISDVLIPAAYLFLGFVLVFAYNDVIAAVRFYGAYDEVFNRMDSRILFGTTMPEIVHAALRVLPGWAYKVLEFFYYGMFAQIGGGLVISALCFGRKTAFRFAGAIVVAYYLALALFCLWPSQGPFYLCARHFAEFPQQLQTYGYQKQFLENVKRIWEHRAISQINTDYYIAFPCMHIAQPLIVAWFLRHWKRMLGILLAYDAIMVAAILLLEWHYAVDLIGGVLVAVLAILIVNPGSFSLRRPKQEQTR